MPSFPLPKPGQLLHQGQILLKARQFVSPVEAQKLTLPSFLISYPSRQVQASGYETSSLEVSQHPFAFFQPNHQISPTPLQMEMQTWCYLGFSGEKINDVKVSFTRPELAASTF